VTPRAYESPEAFRQALEQRLRNASSGGVGMVRARQLLVFDRLLARVVVVLGDAVTLKGGLVLELRLERARSTKDIDLRFQGEADKLVAQLQQAARMDLSDFMAFEVQADPDHPVLENGGIRFRAICRLAGKPYGQAFGIDIGFGDPMLGEPELLSAHDVLAFADIRPPMLRVYPVESHIAEKLHAYTRPRPFPNSRVKDLPDIALLAAHRPLDGNRLREAIHLTFEFRKSHAQPFHCPEPPASWATPYAAMAREDRLPWSTIEGLTVAVCNFLNPVLDGSGISEWQPVNWSWRR
jgi:hypothetical protein